MALPQSSSFQDLDFEKACKELETPDTEGYEFFTESHDVKIYRQYLEVRHDFVKFVEVVEKGFLSLAISPQTKPLF